MQEKIFITLITCDRPDFFKKSFTSLSNTIQEISSDDIKIDYVVVDDGLKPLPYYPINYIKTSGKKGVAFAKNRGIEVGLNRGFEHIFVMEDDIEIINSDIILEYIKMSNYTGIKHFNFALHGNGNLNPDGTPNVRKIVKYPNGKSISLYYNVLGAFSYYHASVLDDVGYMDEGYYNAMEHVKSTYDASLREFTTPWRWFVDITDSEQYLKDIVPDHQQSIIRDSNFQETFKKGLDRFIEQTGFSVVRNYGPEEPIISEKSCIDYLQKVFKKDN